MNDDNNTGDDSELNFEGLQFIPLRREVIAGQVWWIDLVHLDETLVKSEIEDRAYWTVFPKTVVYYELVPLQDTEDLLELRILEGPANEENRRLHYQMYLEQIEDKIRAEKEKQEKEGKNESDSP